MRAMFAVLALGAFVGSVAVVAAGADSSQIPARAKPVAAAQIKPVATVLEIMNTMTIPFSNKVFEASGEPPKDAAGWDAVRGQALALAESGNLLMIGARAKDRAAWMKFSRAQVDAAELAVTAAAARDADKLSAASDALYETCAGCHKVYMKK
jgi:hypothetical protein